MVATRDHSPETFGPWSLAPCVAPPWDSSGERDQDERTRGYAAERSARTPRNSDPREAGWSPSPNVMPPRTVQPSSSGPFIRVTNTSRPPHQAGALALGGWPKVLRVPALGPWLRAGSRDVVKVGAEPEAEEALCDENRDHL